ncbi:HpcH/HpaI aldolase/citrate lyase family protein [Dietzia timorensis]|uniref:Malyl-CoA lyase n=1 Tax=Dietzia timorensis TaxID=499555 RepID=A0A173LNF9_9ACTN|nr:CoA ester lyase [Dietzia timorensis]ANI92787.1 Malyl-CoA lyase [Dietzia timorensis]
MSSDNPFEIIAGLRRAARRTTLAVPGSSAKMLAKATGLDADEVFLDLEDAVAGPAKLEARSRVVEALSAGGFSARQLAVRVNAWDTEYTVGDLTDVVSGLAARVEAEAGAGAEGRRVPLDTVIVPKVREATEVAAVDLILRQLERSHGLVEGAIGMQPQIEDGMGLVNVDAIAAASPRVVSLVFGPGDFMASMGMRSLTVGAQPEGYAVGDAYHYPLTRILVSARAHGIQAIDGPYVKVRDVEGFEKAARHTAGLGYDGKWVLHPSQVDKGNEVFTPRTEDIDRAAEILAAYERSTSIAGGARGAIMVGDEMVDEAGRKMALTVRDKAEAAGIWTGP